MVAFLKAARQIVLFCDFLKGKSNWIFIWKVRVQLCTDEKSRLVWLLKNTGKLKPYGV